MHRKRSLRQQNKGKRLAERVKVHTTLEVSGKGGKMRFGCLLKIRKAVKVAGIVAIKRP